jgi:hypothetical protein
MFQRLTGDNAARAFLVGRAWALMPYPSSLLSLKALAWSHSSDLTARFSFLAKFRVYVGAEDVFILYERGQPSAARQMFTRR